jgi:hypothetical protein
MQRQWTTGSTKPTTTISEGARLRRIAGILALVAVTLGVAAVLHLTGNVTGSAPFDADHAGIAEAIIGIVLLGGALVMFRSPEQARAAGLVTSGFAVAGFVVGLSFTTRGGHAPDIAYHVVFLGVLVASLVALVSAGTSGAAPEKAGRQAPGSPILN